MIMRDEPKVRKLVALDKYVVLLGSTVVIVILLQEIYIMTANFFYSFVLREATLF